MSGNLKFYERLKTLFTDVEKLLTNLIKDSAFGNEAKQKREAILASIKEIRNDYPQLEAPDIAEEHKESSDIGEDGVRYVAVSDLKNFHKAGYLEKKKKEKNLFKLFKAQRRYCVLQDGIFYYFEKDTDQRQNGHIVLKGCEAKQAKDCKKGEYCFEVVREDKRSFQFLAANEQEMHDWIAQTNMCARGDEPGVPEIEQETYEDTDDIDAPDDDNIYEDYQDGSFSPDVNTAPATAADTDEVYEDTGGEPIPDEIYDDGTSEAQPAADEIYDDGTSEPPPLPTPNKSILHGKLLPTPPVKKSEPVAEEVYDDGISEPPPLPTPNKSILHGKPLPMPPVKKSEPAVEEVYDDGTSEPPPPPFPTPNKSALHVGKPLPPPPTKKSEEPPIPPGPPKRNRQKPNIPVPPQKNQPLPPPPNPKPVAEEHMDYDNLYRGLWDCKADDTNELEFKRGDLIQVISKQYEEFSWWVGKMRDKIGLVPKDYLMKAYEKIT